MRADKIFKFSFWKIVSVIIIISGLISTYYRFSKGLGATTNLTDTVPWGLWIGFDFLGVGLAAAGFTIAATVHIFNLHRFEPIVRPAVLTAFIGYSLVIGLLIVDLGRPENFWHPLVMWNVHSVMFEITWCIICYTTVLLLEFAPVILEKFNLKAPIKLLRKISIPVVIAGVLFSTLHQSSFGSLYLITPGRLHPLWYSSILPVHFYISCIAAGISMIIFESYLNARAFYSSLRLKILSELSLAVLTVLIIEFLLKFFDLMLSGKLMYLFTASMETSLFYLEIIVGTFIPIIILSNKNNRENKGMLFIASGMVISGFILNRMNVCITGMVASSGVKYFPSIDEITITFMLLVFALLAFRFVVRNFRVFDDEEIQVRLISLPKTEEQLEMSK